MSDSDICPYCGATCTSDNWLDHCLTHFPEEPNPTTTDENIRRHLDPHSEAPPLKVCRPWENNGAIHNSTTNNEPTPGPSRGMIPFVPHPNELECFKENKCPVCNACFDRKSGRLEEHLINNHPEFYELPQVGEGVSDNLEVIPLWPNLPKRQGTYTEYKAVINKKYDDIIKFFHCVEGAAKQIMHDECLVSKNVKLFCNMRVHFIKDNAETVGNFNSFGHVLLRVEHLQKVWKLICSKLEAEIEEFTKEGSGWKVDSVDEFTLLIGGYDALFASGYIATPYPLNNKKKCLLNIKNNKKTTNGDEKKCFLWSVLAHEKFGGRQFINDPHNHQTRKNKLPKSYYRYQAEVNDTGIKYPMTLEQVRKFENLNPELSFTIIGYKCSDSAREVKKTSPTDMKGKMKQFKQMKSNMCLLYNSKQKKEKHIDLLMLMGATKNHFLLIKDLEDLLRHPKNMRERKICRNCLQAFCSETIQRHEELCTSHQMQKVEYPKDGDVVKFKNWHKTQRAAYTFYCDFEAKLEPTVSTSNVNTVKLAEHKASGYAWICLDWNKEIFESRYYHITGDNDLPAPLMIQELLDCAFRCRSNVEAFQQQSGSNMSLDEDILAEAERIATCCLCNTDLEEDMVRHHNHLPPHNFIGLAHKNCNLQAKQTVAKFTCFFHNGSNYDYHYLVQSVGKLHREGQITSVDVIPKSSEKFISININREESDKKFTKIVFADSLNFTLSSLDKLVEQLVETKDDAKFGIVRQAFKNEINNGADYKLLLKKGIFPYSYIKSVENLKETTLPPINAFWSDLTEDSISPENYQHAQNVWNSFKCKSIADYQDLYVRLDVALLACVIEDRREQLYEQYRLDLNHYLTLPSIALDACLKFTNQEIGLISDPTMYLWVEDSIRGGYCGSGSCRSMKANNPYLPDYDASKPSNYIGYYDANNLYGWAMIQKLPTGNMEWLSQEFLDRMRQNPETFLENLDPNGPVGYMFEVDLHVPPSLHEKFNNFPPAPTKRHIQLVELSESYQVPLMQKLNAGLGAEKLITDLHDKSNYKIHYRLLQLYIDLGVQIKKVHTGLQFDQDNWIKPYIENNTRMRNSFESEFLRDLWKLLSNAIYGKQMENKRNRQSVQLVFDQKKARKLFRKPTIQQIIPIDQDLSLYLMKRVNVKLDTPIIVGSAILDLSKLLMYDIYYNFFYKKYGSDCTLIYTDTDSFIVNVDCQDLYRDIYNDSQFFDLSAYKTDHPLFGKFQKLENKQVLGKLKDEYANKTIQYAVCPRPKMYWLCAHSFQLDRSDGSYKWADCETKKAKGVSKAVTKKSITKQDFLHSVGADFREPNVTPQTIVNMNTIRSHRHQIFTEKLTKKAISAFDTKRFLMDFRNSLAFGHKDIPLYK